MELAASLSPYLCPVGAFLNPSDSVHTTQVKAQAKLFTDRNKAPELWDQSSVNPCKRINAFRKPSQPRWRIDGCADRGTRFFALPIFMAPGLVPKRIDVWIPDQVKHPIPLRQALQSAAAYHTQNCRVNELGISNFILQVLEHWVTTTTNFSLMFEAMPFGSQIVIEEIKPNVDDVRVRFVPTFHKERQLLSSNELQALWNLPEVALPSSVDIMELEHDSQPHDTVSLVRIPHLYASKVFAFKSAIHDARYLYHELNLLLRISPHPNIISKPRHLVVGKTRADEQLRVYGFILDYHIRGTLADALDARTASSTLYFEDQLRWSRQITSTLLFIQEGPARFYSELKPNNLVLSDSGDDIKFIDFEQFGNWETFSAPEIHYVEDITKLRNLDVVPQAKREAYHKLLANHTREEALSRPIYSGHLEGYYTVWKLLTPLEREAATVFSLGKLLWCIFEGNSHTKNSMLEEYEHEIETEFPAFNKTPLWMRSIIEDCTRGSLDWNNDRELDIVRRGSRIYSRARSSLNETEAAVEVMEAMKLMWEQRISHMELFLDAKTRWQRNCATNEDAAFLGFPLRPRLGEVLALILLEEERLDKGLRSA